LPGGNAGPPKLEVFWTSQARQDREYWLRRDRRILKRIDRLIADIREHS
jgi:Txe/YoeB family toxin of Txe-Axe toxin-antitoxin module